MKKKSRKSDQITTLVSYLLSLVIHGAVFLLLILLFGQAAGRAAGERGKKFIAVDLVYVAKAAETAKTAEPAASEKMETAPVVESEVEVVKAVEKSRVKPLEKKEELKGKDTKRLEGEGVSEEQSQPSRTGEEGKAAAGKGIKESPFPTGAFGLFEVPCSKTDENMGITGESYYEVIYKDGALTVIPVMDRLIGDTTTINKARRGIEQNFKADELPQDAEGVLRGLMRCRYERCEENKCEMVKE
ncbi:MAG: hypothetical protein AB1546_03595 [bacterium]